MCRKNWHTFSIIFLATFIFSPSMPVTAKPSTSHINPDIALETRIGGAHREINYLSIPQAPLGDDPIPTSLPEPSSQAASHNLYLPLIMIKQPGQNRVPNAPSNPSPPNNATDQSVDADLSWSGGDPDGDSVTYDVYFEAGDTTPDVLVSNDQSGTSYDPGTLAYDTQYYWQIVAIDEHGAKATGMVWHFTTQAMPQIDRIPIALGNDHTCALTTGGGVKCWGSNNYGQLGDGTTTNRLTPVDVTGLTSGVAAIAAGYGHTCALMTGGGVKCWGSNFYGQLGDGTTTDRLTPVVVSGLTSGVTAIAAGNFYDHTCALMTGGGVKCWGSNFYGQLGDGTTIQRLTPVDVSGLTSGVAAITAGENYTCALTTGGGAKCWGSNDFGQLGDGTRIRRLTPVDVSGLTSGVATISAGYGHTCAVTTGGGAKCWGYNYHGQLGDGTRIDRRTPRDVAGLTNGVAVISAGSLHTCALTTGGGAKCWGSNMSGQLGDGTATDRLTPVDVSGLTSGIAAIATGNRHTCAVTIGGGAKCWGLNANGQLGDGSLPYHLTPVDVSGLTSGVTAITTGGFEDDYGHTCALTTGGGVKCWGWNANGQLGDGTTTDRLTPVDVSGLTSGVAAIAAGYGHTCALMISGGAKCWGSNGSGQLGDGTTIHRLTPVDVSGLTNGVAAIAAGYGHTCALTTGGGAKCWGYNEYGSLGDGTTIHRLTPVDVSGLTSGVAAIATGNYHTCSVTTSGGAKCWGANYSGQLGDGTTIQRLTPVDVSGLTSVVAAIAAGASYTCAVTTGGGGKCWGYKGLGQLGDGTAIFSTIPVDVAGFGGAKAAWREEDVLTPVAFSGVGLSQFLDLQIPGQARPRNWA